MALSAAAIGFSFSIRSTVSWPNGASRPSQNSRVPAQTSSSSVYDTAVAGGDSHLPKRAIRFRIDGKRRWDLAARNKNAYVWQQGRFEGDIEFWESGLAQTESVKPVKRGECLRFFLDKENDFRFFHNVATQELQSANWLVDTAPEELQDTDED